MIGKVLFLIYAIIWLILTIFAYLGKVGFKRTDGISIQPFKSTIVFLGWPIFLCMGLIGILFGTIKIKKQNID